MEQISELDGDVGNPSVSLLAFDTWEQCAQYENVKVAAFTALWLKRQGAPSWAQRLARRPRHDR